MRDWRVGSRVDGHASAWGSIVHFVGFRQRRFSPSALSHSSAACSRCLFKSLHRCHSRRWEDLRSGSTKGGSPTILPLRIGPIRPSARRARADAKGKMVGAEANFFGDKNRQVYYDGGSSRLDTGRDQRRNRGRHPLSRTDSPPVQAVGRRQFDRVTVSEKPHETAVRSVTLTDGFRGTARKRADPPFPIRKLLSNHGLHGGGMLLICIAVC